MTAVSPALIERRYSDRWGGTPALLVKLRQF